MVFPKDTKITKDEDDLVLDLVPAVDSSHRCIRITQLTPNRFDDAMNFLAVQYKTREPLLRTLQLELGKDLNLQDLTALFRSRFESYIFESYMAVDVTPRAPSTEDPSETSTIIGVCFNRILSTDGTKNIPETADPCVRFLSPVLTPVDFIDALSYTLHSSQSSTDNTEDGPSISRVFEIGAAAVDYRFCTRRIGEAFVMKSIDSAKKRQCDVIRCDSTSHYFAKALRSLGFQSVVDLPFPDLTIGQKNVHIETAHPHECLRVLALHFK